MSDFAPATQWQALIRTLGERLAALPRERFYNAQSDTYHPIREQILEAFDCTSLKPGAYDRIMFLPSVPDEQALSAHLETMPLDLLSLHVSLWFSAERWGVNTVYQMFDAGLLQRAMTRFADESARLPFVSFDVARIEELALTLDQPDPSDSVPDRSDGAL